jgi:hypothetical protein
MVRAFQFKSIIFSFNGYDTYYFLIYAQRCKKRERLGSRSL